MEMDAQRPALCRLDSVALAQLLQSALQPVEMVFYMDPKHVMMETQSMEMDALPPVQLKLPTLARELLLFAQLPVVVVLSLLLSSVTMELPPMETDALTPA
jgi:L-fucose mutarotase/ribose pyranase (RbsD/FucU family)